MKLMKFITAVVLLIGISSCDRKSCENVTCPANKTCLNGTCVCPAGLEGENCDQDATQKFIGNYQANESCISGSALVGTYFPYITADPNNTSYIVINGFLGQFTIYGLVQSDNSNRGTIVVIPNQNLGGGSGNYVSGQGNFDINSNRMTLNLEYYINFENKACTHSFYKQP